MRIALAQLNYHIGNFESNFQKVKDAVDRAVLERADLIVFSELAVSGYPARDFLEDKTFIQNCRSYLEKTASICTEIACIIGCPVENPLEAGKNLFNAAIFIRNGKIESQTNKALLPTYDVFDEYRYFEPASEFRCIELNGKKIALTICEDLWNIVDPLYVLSPMDELMKEKPDLMINIAASPFNYGQAETRFEILRLNTAKYGLPLLYVNHVGAQTELIFDGGSVFLSAQGEIQAQLNYFEEDFAVLDFYDSTGIRNVLQYDRSDLTATSAFPAFAEGIRLYKENVHPAYVNINRDEYEVPLAFRSETYTARIHKALLLGISDYFGKLGFKSAVLGLSGGIDSALVCALAAEALGPDRVTAVLMPSEYSSDHSVSDAEKLADSLGIEHFTVPIAGISASFNKSLKPIFKELPFNLTEENIQARTRGTLLMAISNKLGHILLNTSNKSEAAVGYGTLYGDMCGAISVLGDVYKTQVYLLANYINRDREIIPQNSILKPPSAELRPGQKDSDSLPEYDILDQILYFHIERKWSAREIIQCGFEATVVNRTISLVNSAEFKRYQSPPILRVSPKAFGMGRRMPIVGKYS